MVFVDLSFEEMLDSIKFREWIKQERVVLMEFPDCPKIWHAPRYYNIPPNEKTIEPFFDLWAQFVSSRYKTPDYIISIVNDRKNLYGPESMSSSIISLTLENAFYHGNQNNPYLPVNVNVFDGESGLVVRVSDCGFGFDFKRKISILEMLDKKNKYFIFNGNKVKKRDRYFMRKGSGLYYSFYSSAKVSFEDSGKSVNILYEC